MVSDILSAISSSERDTAGERSNSSSVTESVPSSRCARPGPSVPASRFKGVVLQQNGHWGAQIYANHQRIWLGTFRTEQEAAMAYDSAGIKVRSGDAHRNFPWTSINAAEPEFQSHYGTEAVLGMIRDGTYPYKFTEYLTARTWNAEADPTVLDMAKAGAGGNEGLTWKLLFQKELTPSDVGKLNRIVIPKRYAVKYFPVISEPSEENKENADEPGKVKDAELVFYDKYFRLWKFRYCYWSSSQSYVLTRGWNRFVKEYNLKANDVVAFYNCECRDGEEDGKSFWIIEVDRGEGKGDARNVVGFPCADLQLRLGSCFAGGSEDVKVEQQEEEVTQEADDTNGGFRLFGVRII